MFCLIGMLVAISLLFSLFSPVLPAFAAEQLPNDILLTTSAGDILWEGPQMLADSSENAAPMDSEGPGTQSNAILETSLEGMIDSALESEKPVFLFFYADWCHFCQQQKPMVDELEQVYAEKIAFIRVNGPESPEATNEFGVRSYPDMFLIAGKNEEGYVGEGFSGFTTKEVLEGSLTGIVENGRLAEALTYPNLTLVDTGSGSACNCPGGWRQTPGTPAPDPFCHNYVFPSPFCNNPTLINCLPFLGPPFNMDCSGCSFVNACIAHNRCYDTCVDKSQREAAKLACDRAFLSNMQSICLSCPMRNECMNWAATYYLFVRSWLGVLAYNDGQGKGCQSCQCCDPRSCDDGDSCTTDYCEGADCRHDPIAGCDNPDDNFDVSSTEVGLDQALDLQGQPKVAIVRLGNTYAVQALLASLGEPTVVVDTGFSPELVHDYPVLVIPSGGLYGIDSLQSFRDHLGQYVSDGGTLVVFTQQHGYEYEALPGGEVSGFGWAEDQSCQYGSVGIANYHPILSGQDSVTLDVNVDGFFTSYPDNSTVLLSRTKNGMPAMLMYEYGDGRVIATTAYTDWAYMKGQASTDEESVIRDLVSWAKEPQEIAEYDVGDTIDILVDVSSFYPAIPGADYTPHVPGDLVTVPIEATNSGSEPADHVTYIVITPKYETQESNASVSVPPKGTATIDFSYQTTESSDTGVYFVAYSLYSGETVVGGGLGSAFGLGIGLSQLSEYQVNFTLKDPGGNVINAQTTNVTVPPGETGSAQFTYGGLSELGIWSLGYEIVDYQGTLLDSGTKMFAVSKYAENPDGWVYQGSEITFGVNSESEHYPRGGNAEFIIQVWNHGDTDKTVTAWYSFPHNYWATHDSIYGSPGTTRPGHSSNLHETLTIPAQSSASFTYSVPVVSYDRLWADFYEGDETSNKYLGGASRGFYVFDPSIAVNVSTDKDEYAKGEIVSIPLSLTNRQSSSYDISATVKVLDPERSIVFEESLDVALAGEASEERVITFSLPGAAQHGLYVVSAEAYVGDSKMGSGSTYFEVSKDYLLELAFDRPNKTYGERDSITMELRVTNLSATPWNSIVDIASPVLAFADSLDLAIGPSDSAHRSYGLSIPVGITPGTHAVTVSIQADGSVEEYHFYVPESELTLSVDGSSFIAGDNIGISLTNTGGVDTTCDCSMRLYDSRLFRLSEVATHESVMAQETKPLSFTIPGQAVDGEYYLIVSCNDLSTDVVSSLTRLLDVDGVQAALTSVTDKKVYSTSENISIQTNVTNLDGELANGVLNLQIFSRTGLQSSVEADSAGKEFYLAYSDNYYSGTGALFVTSDRDTFGVVEIPGIGFSQTFTVAANAVTTVDIPPEAMVSGSNNIENKAIHVFSEDEITAYVLNPGTPVATNDAYLGLPLDILGDKYVILAYPETLSARGFPPTYGPSEFAIVAPYDETVVTITPGVSSEILTLSESAELIEPNTEPFAPIPKEETNVELNAQEEMATELLMETPFTITLQGNQTYTLQGSNPLEDLTGTIIESNNPIAVFAGVRCADVPAGYSACDHMVEQMMPVDTWGREFDTFPFMPRQNNLGDFLRILAATDETIITVNNSVVGAIDRGQFLELVVSEPMEITTDKPVMVAQYLTGEQYEGRIGDPSECLIPPTEQFQSEYTFIIPTGYAENYVNIIAPEAAVLLLDGAPVDYTLFTPFGTKGLSAATISLGEGSHNISGNAPFGIYIYGYDQYDSYAYPGGLALKAIQQKLVWEKTIPIDLLPLEARDIDTVIDIPSEIPGVTGKLELLATLYAGNNQIVDQTERYPFFITDEDTYFTLETDKEVYKPNEPILITGQVQNNGDETTEYNLVIKKDSDDIYSESFVLDVGEAHQFTISLTSESSFILEGIVNDIRIADFIAIEYPNVDVSIIAPDVVGLGDFNAGIMIENIANVDSDINVTLADHVWDVVIPAGESRLLETIMGITEDTVLIVHIAGDVERTVQKEIIMGENAVLNLDTQAVYLEGLVEIPVTVVNTGLLDTEFDVIFSIGEQQISRTFFVPQGQSVMDVVSFDLAQGAYTLDYITPFEAGSVEIYVGVPEFVVTQLPENVTLILGQDVSWTFGVTNIGGAEGEAHLKLMVPDWEETMSTWIKPGEENTISFDFTIPDDLAEGEYKAIYEINGSRGEFTFFVEGAQISVQAMLDKELYIEGETAFLTLAVTNDSGFDLSLYARVQLDDYAEIQPFQLIDAQTLQFGVPVSFNGNKLFYGIYMDSGRALHLNSIYIHEKEDVITLYTDKQVYSTGETVTVFIESAQSGTLNLTAPGYSTELPIDGQALLTFVVPELRSGTYYIDYTFDGFSSSYPFDVIGYSARILEFSLDKGSYGPGDTMTMKANVEVNRDVEGVFRIGLYNPGYNLIDEFNIPYSFQQGENAIKAEMIFTGQTPGIHSLINGVYGDLPGHSLVLLAAGIEYFDSITANTPPVADADGPYSGNEGSLINFDASGSSDPDGDPLQYRWDFDNDSFWDTLWSSSPSASYTYPDDYIGVAVLEVSDYVDTDTDTLTVTVNNVAPSITTFTMSQPNPQFILPIVHTLTFNASFTDPGWLDTHTATLDFGDGTVVGVAVLEENDAPDATGTTQGTHVYTAPGIYTVTLTINDNDGGADVETMEVTVVDEFGTLQDLDEYIQGLPNSAFKAAPKDVVQRKGALHNMIIAINGMLIDQEYNGAIQALTSNIRQKADGYFGGKANNDWIKTYDEQYHVCMEIDDLIAYLSYLKTL
jgi:thiol-disulfide isomerase/thioredoxin